MHKMEIEKVKVLYVDDEEGNLTAFRATFRRDFDVHVASNGPDALAFMEKHEIHVVISDQRMPGMTGSEFLALVRGRWPHCIRLLLTGFSDIQAVVDAVNLGGIHAYITKPWDPTDLKLRIEQAHEVHTLREEREKLFHRYRQVFDDSGDPIVIVDTMGRLREVNNAAVALLRMERGEVLGLSIDGLITDLPEMVGAMRAHRKGTLFSDIDLSLRIPDGRVIDCLLTATYLGHSRGGPTLFQAMIKDISDRKKEELRLKKLNKVLDQRVAIRTRQLMDAMDDLGAFSYSVAHDLRSPLKNIKVLSEHLSGKAAMRGDEEDRDLSHRIHKGSTRLITLVDDLLRFSRTDNQEIVREQIDLAEVLGECIQNLEQEHEHVEFVLPMQGSASLWADRSMLTVALTNLITNAIKFTRKREHPRVEVGHNGDKENVVVWIKDNGVGFDGAKNEQVFGVFKRLHNSDQFEGTGIGLALVHRIMKKHSGSCWAEGVIDQGATFSLRFPVHVEQEQTPVIHPIETRDGLAT